MTEPKKKLPESLMAEAVTVAWTMAAMAALLCEVAAVIARLYHAAKPAAENVGMVADLLWLDAGLAGILTLLLVPAVWLIRRVAPPRGFTLFALVVALLPLLVGLVARLAHAAR